MTKIVAPLGEHDVPAMLVREFRLLFLPRLFASMDEVAASLVTRGHALGPWFEKLCKEYDEGDAIFGYDPDDPTHRVLRFIRTTTGYIKRNKSLLRHGQFYNVEVLREWMEWPDGTVTKREYNNTLSGKMRWSEWNVKYAFRRELEEETGIRLSHGELRRCVRRVGEGMSYAKEPGPAALNEDGAVHFKDNDSKRPGVATHNKVFHHIVDLPQRHWRRGYKEYHEEFLRVFVWWPAGRLLPKEPPKPKD